MVSTVGTMFENQSFRSPKSFNHDVLATYVRLPLFSDSQKVSVTINQDKVHNNPEGNEMFDLTLF